MDNLEMLRRYRDRIQDEYLDARSDEGVPLMVLNELRERLVDLDEYIERLAG